MDTEYLQKLLMPQFDQDKCQSHVGDRCVCRFFWLHIIVHLLTFTEASFYLEGQQTAVDLCSLDQSAAVVAVDICAALISGQINQ